MQCGDMTGACSVEDVQETCPAALEGTQRAYRHLGLRVMQRWEVSRA